MDRAGDLENPYDVARFSDDKAVSTLRPLIQTVEGLKLTLLQEAHGVAPIGSAASAVDAVLGEGTFAVWLTAFQGREHQRCAEIIQSRGASGR
jgi:hypothetical protein